MNEILGKDGGYAIAEPIFQNFGSASNIGEGSGPIGGLINLGVDASRGDIGAVAADAGGLALDALGFVTNPLGSLASAGIGWLIEHIGFLKEGLDLLAGDPDAVTKQREVWISIGNHLNSSAARYDRSMVGVTQVCGGPAVTAYAKAAQAYQTQIKEAAGQAQRTAQEFTQTATFIGLIRATIRDAIAEFVAGRLIKWAAAAALTPVTFGASQAAFITESIVAGSRLAAKIVKLLRKVSDKVGGAMKSVGKSMDDLAELTKKLTKKSGKAGKADVPQGATKAASRSDDLSDRVKDFNDRTGVKQALDDNQLRRDAAGFINNKNARAAERKSANAERSRLKEWEKDLATQRDTLKAERRTLRDELAKSTVDDAKILRNDLVEKAASDPRVRAIKEAVVQTYADQPRREEDAAKNAEEDRKPK